MCVCARVQKSAAAIAARGIWSRFDLEVRCVCERVCLSVCVWLDLRHNDMDVGSCLSLGVGWWVRGWVNVYVHTCIHAYMHS